MMMGRMDFDDGAGWFGGGLAAGWWIFEGSAGVFGRGGVEGWEVGSGAVSG